MVVKVLVLVSVLIFNLTKDKLLAQEIFMNSFLELKQTLEKIKCVLLPVILRHTYFYTTKYLERISLTPKTINPPKEAELINLFLTQCNSLNKAASILNITVGETKKRLCVEFLNLRIQKNISENALRVVN